MESGPVMQVMERRWSFLGVFFMIFTLTYVTLLGMGLVPSAIAPELPARPSAPVIAPVVEDERPAAIVIEDGELPVRIEIPAIGTSANVSNPNTTSIAALDRALLTGAVRYPGTGELGEKGNVLIFGHSSYLPIVHNQSFKAFNGIQNLKRGDRIIVHGENRTYVYSVDTVEESNTATGEIPLNVEGSKLTLATCDTFGEKSDRWIVTANLVDIVEN